MAQINVLSKETIDKIAAGEVVERPASVVKELLENAVDAGARAITVEIKEGGISFIRVTDNGCGMEHAQAPKAFLRHATSKIRTANDLSHIASLGFRGEALSSIAAVSRVELITKTAGELTGLRYRIEGGEEVEAEEVGAPDGTTFLIRNLFFNTPVRKKFLKQPQTEGGYVSDLMEHMALANPDISFQYINNGQVRFHTSGNGDLREIIYRIYGRDISCALLPVDVTQQGIHMEGFLGKPEINRANRNFEIYFVNGRFIKSNLVSKAMEEGYRKYVMQHKFPFAVLHFHIDAGEVDVNVHPTKMEVRFTNQPVLYNFIASQVEEALHQVELIPEVSLSKPERKTGKTLPAGTLPEPFEKKRAAKAEGASFAHVKAGAAEGETISAETIPAVGSAVESQAKKTGADTYGEAESQESGIGKNSAKWQEFRNYTAERANEKNAESIAKEYLPEENKTYSGAAEQAVAQGMRYTVPAHAGFVSAGTKGMGAETETETESSMEPEGESFFVDQRIMPKKEELSQRADAASEAEVSKHNSVEKPEQLNLFEEKLLTQEAKGNYQILGQIFHTYWLIAFHDKLFIVDQHAAHEKVKYERFMKRLEERNVESQMLNPPVIVTLTGKEEAVLKESAGVFSEMGFEIEAFGGNEYALRSVPAELYGCSESGLFKEMLDELTEGDIHGAPAVVRQRIATMACKAAVKGNTSFDCAGMEALMEQLLALEDPYHCPHGRPTIISMSKYEIEKKFKRIV